MGVNLPEMQYLWVSRPAFGWQGGLGVEQAQAWGPKEP